MEDFFYTGIGARKTPGPMKDFYRMSPLYKMYRWGHDLGVLKLILRSGGADGADHAFESGCDIASGKKEIYLPWEYFNGSDSKLFYIPPEAYEIAADIYGPTWKYQKLTVKKLMARNMMQVSGLSLEEPSSFVICWTPDGCNTKEGRTKKTGGTGQAIAYADELNIPIFNLKNAEEELNEFFIEWFDNVCDNR